MKKPYHQGSSKGATSRKQIAKLLKKSPAPKAGPPKGQINFASDPLCKEANILIATTVWKRPHIFKFWLERMKPLGCDILVIGSPDDECEALAKEYNCAYIQKPNSPLGAKFNARPKYFIENKQYTHLLLVGSDDVICPKAFRIIEEKLKRYDVINWKDCYYYEWETGRIAYMPGFIGTREGEPMAPGRCLSRRVVEHLGSQMWSSALQKYPDGNLWKRLKCYGNQTILSCREEDCAIIDVKSADENLNSMASLFKHKLAYDSDSMHVRNLVKNVRIGRNAIIGRHVELGEGTVIKNNVEIRDNVKIGKNCYIDSGVCITGNAEIGNNVTLRNYVVVARGSKIGDGSFLAPRVMFNNLDTAKKTIGGAQIGRNCFIGTNTVLHHGISICDNVNVGALSFVNRDITEEGTYVGQPAKKL